MSNAYPFFVVDAFTNRLFGGNPAAVCPLTEWLSDATMQQLATENNLSETAFFVREEDVFHIRWFTPEYEIDLCGHATLASAFVIFNYLMYHQPVVKFSCKSGLLEVKKRGHMLELDFPLRIPQPCPAPADLLQGINLQPVEVLRSRDYFVVLRDEAAVRAVVPNFQYLNRLDTIGVIVTAPGNEVDFVSRFFVPNSVIGEDPVTGSAHCNLIPYWSQRLGKQVLTARQLSARGGELFCSINNNRVGIAGEAVLYSKGEYHL